MNISEDQQSIIENKLAAAELNNESLSIDILDHVCCLIEDKLSAGSPFDAATEQAFTEFQIDDIKAVELETELLIENRKLMKKRTLITGVLASMIMIIAFILEVTMLRGGPLLMFVGAFIGIFGFGLMTVFDRFSYSKSSSERLKSIVGFIGTGFFLAGIAFHFTAWPFGPTLLITGGIALLGYLLIDHISAKKNELSL